jgi:hypothetical protein
MSTLDNFHLDPKPEVRASKIVQICCDEYRLYALTDTGEIWLNGTPTPGWEQLPPLPTPTDPT